MVRAAGSSQVPGSRARYLPAAHPHVAPACRSTGPVCDSPPSDQQVEQLRTSCLDEPSGRTVWTNCLDELSGRTVWTNCLDELSGRTVWTTTRGAPGADFAAPPGATRRRPAQRGDIERVLLRRLVSDLVVAQSGSAQPGHRPGRQPAPPSEPEPAGLLPDPEPRPIRVPIISVDDHLIEPPDLFEGRMPRAPRRPGAAHRRARRRHAVLAVRGTAPTRTSGSTPSPAGAARHLEHGPVTLRRDAARLLRHPRPRRRHGHERSVGVAVLPVAGGRILRLGVLALGGPRARPGCVRAWNDWHARCGPAPIPSGSSRCSFLGSPTSALAAEEIRRNAARGFKAVSFPEFPAQLGAPVDLLGEVGPVLRGVRGDRRPSSASTPAPRRGRRCPPRTRPSSSSRRCSPSTRCSPRPSGCGRACRCASPTSRWRCPRAGSAGCRCSSTASTTCSSTPPRARRASVAVGAAPERGAASQLLVLHDRRPVDHRAASPDRRRPHHGRERLPPRRLDVARHPARAREDAGAPARGRVADDRGGNAARLFRHPLPAARRLERAGARTATGRASRPIRTTRRRRRRARRGAPRGLGRRCPKRTGP